MIIKKISSSDITTSDAQGVFMRPPLGSKSTQAVSTFLGRNGEFRQTKLKKSNGDQSIVFAKQGQKSWRHPWHVDLTWSDKLVDAFGKPAPEGWAATVAPGFINGIDPVAPGLYVDSFKAGGDSIGGERQEIRGVKEMGKQQAGLMDYPLIGLNAASVWSKPQAVPYMIKLFFANLLLERSGATMKDIQQQSQVTNGGPLGRPGQDGFIDNAVAAAMDLVGSADFMNGASDDPGKDYREVLCTDFFIVTARPALKEETWLSSDGFLGIINNSIPTFNTLALTNYPRPAIRFAKMPQDSAAANFEPFKAAGSGKSKNDDDGLDYLKLGTVWAVSPEKEAPWVQLESNLGFYQYDTSKWPDKSWSMHVSYDVFWNLCHRAKIPKLNTVGGAGSVVAAQVGAAAAAGPLGLMAAAPIISTNSMLMNMQDNLIQGASNAKANKGLYWTT